MKKTKKHAILYATVSLLLILLVSTLVIINDLWALPLSTWMEYRSVRSEIPQSGTYVCQELKLSVSFGQVTELIFHDGTIVPVAIDQGNNIMQLNPNDLVIRGSYRAYLSKQYVEVSFDTLPIEFECEKRYRFYLQDSE